MRVKSKKGLFTFLLLIVMLFALPTIASAYKNQWVTTNGKTYYYGSNGKVTTGGPKSIKKDGKTHLYLFDSTGALVKNQITYIKARKKYYYSLSDGTLLTSFKKVGTEYYYGNSKGYLNTGLKKCSNYYYYFDASKGGKAVKNTWKTVGKYKYYFRGNGRAYKNTAKQINGKWYMFDKNSHMLTGVQKYGKYYYGFSKKTGERIYGLRKFSGKYYFFDENNRGRAITNTFKKINGNTYYFSKTGVRQTGWRVFGSKKYYFDPKKGGAQTFGKKTIDGVTYNFGTKGWVKLTYSSSSKKTIRVNRKKCVVTIYEGSTPIKAMTCSVGMPGCETPTGTFMIQDHLRWHELNGPSYGQYCSHFLPSYLFHSVPIYGTSKNPYGVRASDYNNLGIAASGGCIRLTVADAKWIYDNCPVGSTVIIGDSQPTPLGKPTITKMKAGTIGKDPTDKWS